MKRALFEYCGPILVGGMLIVCVWSLISGKILFSSKDNQIYRDEQPGLFWVWTFAQFGFTAAMGWVWWFLYSLGIGKVL